MTDLRCPKCSELMTATEKQSTSIWSCAGCHAIWIDLTAHESEVGKMETFWATMAEAGGMAEHACPTCTYSRLQEVEFAGCHLDACTTCLGVLFDAGELERVRSHLEQAGRPTFVDHGVEAVKIAGEFVIDEVVGRALAGVLEFAAELAS